MCPSHRNRAHIEVCCTILNFKHKQNLYVVPQNDRIEATPVWFLFLYSHVLTLLLINLLLKAKDMSSYPRGQRHLKQAQIFASQ